MRVLLAPDKFKGSFTAAEVCERLRAGLLAVHPSAEVVSHPLADGGEGTMDVLLGALGGGRRLVEAAGPLGDALRAELGEIPGGEVVVESALFCGLSARPAARRNPMEASTYGLGLALRQVLSSGPRAVLVGLGGSATVDGGLGLARALGFRLVGPGGSDLRGRGADLGVLEAIEPPEGPASPPWTRVEALCDVSNVLCGPEGAAPIFAPQKGASPQETALLAEGLERFARIVARDLGVEVADLPGSGAAGGLGAGLRAFLDAEMVAGAERVMRLTGLHGRLEGVNLLVTGEGAYDAGSRRGKVATEVMRLGREVGIPVVIVCGRWEGGSPPPGVRVLHGEGILGKEGLEGLGRRLV